MTRSHIGKQNFSLFESVYSEYVLKVHVRHSISKSHRRQNSHQQ